MKVFKLLLKPIDPKRRPFMFAESRDAIPCSFQSNGDRVKLRKK